VHRTQQEPGLKHSSQILSELCSVDQWYDSFQAYAVFVEEMNSRSKGVLFPPLGKKHSNMSQIVNKPITKLHKAPQPPLSYPGATPDSDRAKKPPLAEPPVTDQDLKPGDRVEGLGNFGKRTGEFGTVEQSNEEDAIVKWDDDGRKRLHQVIYPGGYHRQN
jgi:hypothetical protein